MKISDLPLIGPAVGVLLVALSFVWPSMIGKALWSEQQAREHSEAAAELHRLSHQHGHAANHGGETQAEHKAPSLEEARQRYERSKTMLHRARSYRRQTTGLLKWAGAVCSLLGAAGYFLLRPAAN